MAIVTSSEQFQPEGPKVCHVRLSVQSGHWPGEGDGILRQYPTQCERVGTNLILIKLIDIR